jgi:hypothetical protein
MERSYRSNVLLESKEVAAVRMERGEDLAQTAGQGRLLLLNVWTYRMI